MTVAQNTVQRKLDPKSPVHIPVVLNGLALIIGTILWIYNMPDKEIPIKNLIVNSPSKSNSKV